MNVEGVADDAFGRSLDVFNNSGALRHECGDERFGEEQRETSRALLDQILRFVENSGDGFPGGGFGPAGVFARGAPATATSLYLRSALCGSISLPFSVIFDVDFAAEDTRARHRGLTTDTILRLVAKK